MRFGLITEGISEHRIIKQIIEKYFKEYDLPAIRQIQPQLVHDKQNTIGGWREVLKYCERTDDLGAALNELDYLVIQIDTDQSQTKPFSVSHTKPDNTAKTEEELYADIVAKLQSLIHPEILEVQQHKIFFAICIHTVECWLLPLYYTNNHQSDTNTCLSTLNEVLRKKNIHTIATKDKNNFQSIRTYETILKNWRKKAEIIASAQHNVGFKNFIESLREIEKNKIIF